MKQASVTDGWLRVCHMCGTIGERGQDVCLCGCRMYLRPRGVCEYTVIEDNETGFTIRHNASGQLETFTYGEDAG
jgi:hypothetical protein